MQEFDATLASLETGLFGRIPAQLTDDDKRALLAVQNALRKRIPGYTYLEIGSHLGGSIQPHLMDTRCAGIVSIDKRPDAVPDDRGYDIPYPGNSTAHMLALLREISADAATRIQCFDTDVSAIPLARLRGKPDLCFIDGEHTERAVRADYAFCRKAMGTEGVILFHDANIIYSGIQKIIEDLETDGTPFRAYVLPSSIFVVTFGGMDLHEDPAIQNMLLDNHRQYLFGMMSMEHYREVYNRRPVRFMRAVKRLLTRVRGLIG
jgi:hypothetical protein